MTLDEGIDIALNFSSCGGVDGGGRRSLAGELNGSLDTGLDVVRQAED